MAPVAQPVEPVRIIHLIEFHVLDFQLPKFVTGAVADAGGDGQVDIGLIQFPEHLIQVLQPVIRIQELHILPISFLHAQVPHAPVPSILLVDLPENARETGDILPADFS